MWFGNRCYPPKDVQLALESLFGESVAKIKVIQYSIFVRFHWRAIATTRPNRIYLRGSGKEFFSDGPLVLHEYFHVIRQWGTGDMTIARYLIECFRRGYWDNRFEVEAREYTDTEIFRYRALLAQHRTAELPPGVHPIRKKSA
jgi:hypothetical protein